MITASASDFNLIHACRKKTAGSKDDAVARPEKDASEIVGHRRVIAVHSELPDQGIDGGCEGRPDIRARQGNEEGRQQLFYEDPHIDLVADTSCFNYFKQMQQKCQESGTQFL